MVGRIVGDKYRMLERIGAGAMATIYRARRVSDDLEVAVKVVLPKLAKNRTVAARIQREVKAASKLDHPGCVKIYDWGVDGRTLYIAMELITGQDVFEVIQRDRRLEQGRAVDIALEVLDVLAHAHAAGVIHRDLKPENIMLLDQPKDGYQLKILDFGIAKLVGPDLWSDETVPEKLTRAGSAVGTPSHMAPEQARGIEVDARADIYACGVLLYETVSGHLPFEGKSPIEVAVKQVRDPPRPPSEHFAEIHPELERIILRCLEKDPAARWHSAVALSHELKALRPQLGTAAEPPADLSALTVRPTSGTVVIDASDAETTNRDIPPHLRALIIAAQKSHQMRLGNDDDVATLHFSGANALDDEVTLLASRDALGPPPLDDKTLRRAPPPADPDAIITHPMALAPESDTAPRGRPLATSVAAPAQASDFSGYSQHQGHAQTGTRPEPAQAQVVLSTYGTQRTHASETAPDQRVTRTESELDRLLRTVPAERRRWLFSTAVVVVMLVVITATYLLVR